MAGLDAKRSGGDNANHHRILRDLKLHAPSRQFGGNTGKYVQTYHGHTPPDRVDQLIPSSNGRFEVTLGDELVYSKAATGKHTTNEFIVDQVRARLKQQL